jgi:hypothetical protein
MRLETLPLTAVLRSWEDRFGARLLEVGFADIKLLVERQSASTAWCPARPAPTPPPITCGCWIRRSRRSRQRCAAG